MYCACVHMLICKKKKIPTSILFNLKVNCFSEQKILKRISEYIKFSEASNVFSNYPSQVCRTYVSQVGFVKFSWLEPNIYLYFVFVFTFLNCIYLCVGKFVCLYIILTDTYRYSFIFIFMCLY